MRHGPQLGRLRSLRHTRCAVCGSIAALEAFCRTHSPGACPWTGSAQRSGGRTASRGAACPPAASTPTPLSAVSMRQRSTHFSLCKKHREETVADRLLMQEVTCMLERDRADSMMLLGRRPESAPASRDPVPGQRAAARSSVVPPSAVSCLVLPSRHPAGEGSRPATCRPAVDIVSSSSATIQTTSLAPPLRCVRSLDGLATTSHHGMRKASTSDAWPLTRSLGISPQVRHDVLGLQVRQPQILRVLRLVQQHEHSAADPVGPARSAPAGWGQCWRHTPRSRMPCC